MVAKSKHPALIPNFDLPKTEVNTWQLGRSVKSDGKGNAIRGTWSAFHVASAEARAAGGYIETGYFDPMSIEVFAANKIGAAYAADPYRNTEQ